MMRPFPVGESASGLLTVRCGNLASAAGPPGLSQKPTSRVGPATSSRRSASEAECRRWVFFGLSFLG